MTSSSSSSSSSSSRTSNNHRQLFLLVAMFTSSVAVAQAFGRSAPPSAIKFRQRQQHQQNPVVYTSHPGAAFASQHSFRGGVQAAAVSSNDGISRLSTVPGTPLFVVDSNASSTTTKVSLGAKIFGIIGSIWGTGGFVYILSKAVVRVLPIALEPFSKTSTLAMTPFQWSMYAATAIFFAYYEGYKGFQTKFSPLVVKRSFSLVSRPQQSIFMKLFQFVFAPLYSMGLFQATKKRTIVSWCVSLGVAAIVAMVKRLQQPWRAIIDGGVVIGLTWGALSIIMIYVYSWFQQAPPPKTDACLPKSN